MQDFGKVVDILLRHRFTVLDGLHDLGHIGGELGYILWVKVNLHGVVQGFQDALVSAVDEVVPFTQIILGGLNAPFSRADKAHKAGGHNARQRGAQLGHAQLIHLGHLLPHFRDGFRSTRDLGGDEHVHGAVLVQDGHIVRAQHI